jgi:hypothetical protein
MAKIINEELVHQIQEVKQMVERKVSKPQPVEIVQPAIKSPMKGRDSPKTRVIYTAVFSLTEFKAALKILIKILLQTDGRDKIFKSIQYFSKLLLVYRKNTPAEKLASHFSLTRKILRLGHCVEPLHDLVACLDNDSGKITLNMDLFVALLGIANDISDDIYALHKMGIITDKKLASKAETFSARAWYLGILIDLHSALKSERKLAKQLSESPENEKAEKAYKMQLVSTAKLLCDFGFCTYDVFHLQSLPHLQTLFGFGAALLSTYKLYVKAC